MNDFALSRRFWVMQFAILLPLLASLAAATPEVIDDAGLRSGFQKKLGEFADAGGHPTAGELAEQVEKVPTSWAPEEGAGLAGAAPGQAADAVHLIGSVYKCGKCDDWHLGGVATAWALSRDGLMVTNHHVFEKARGKVMGVSDRHGNVRPIIGLLAADADADTALFRVEADDLVALPLGPAPAVGEEIEVISHPHNRFFTHTFGKVSRYWLMRRSGDRPAVPRLSVTADYAKGSSGGPVLDTSGRVVGMVSSTQSIYYESNDGRPKGPLQMVVKICVPAGALGNLIKEPEPEPEPGTAAETAGA